LRQNLEIDRIDLPRIQDDDELEALKASNALVPIRESVTIRSTVDSILGAAIAVRGRAISSKISARLTTSSSTHRFR